MTLPCRFRLAFYGTKLVNVRLSWLADEEELRGRLRTDQSSKRKRCPPTSSPPLLRLRRTFLSCPESWLPQAARFLHTEEIAALADCATLRLSFRSPNVVAHRVSQQAPAKPYFEQQARCFHLSHTPPCPSRKAIVAAEEAHGCHRAHHVRKPPIIHC